MHTPYLSYASCPSCGSSDIKRTDAGTLTCCDCRWDNDQAFCQGACCAPPECCYFCENHDQAEQQTPIDLVPSRPFYRALAAQAQGQTPEDLAELCYVKLSLAGGGDAWARFWRELYRIGAEVDVEFLLRIGFDRSEISPC